MPVHYERVLRTDNPAVNRFKGTSSSEKVTQDYEIVRKIGKRVDYQNEVSAIVTMRLENLCERGAWILQIDIMGAFFGVSLNLFALARDAKVLNSTKVSQSSRRFGGELNGAWNDFYVFRDESWLEEAKQAELSWR